MKVLIVTDSPMLTSGLGRTCRETVNYLTKNTDYTVAVAGWFHEVSEKDKSLPYTIFPANKILSPTNPQLAGIINNYEPDFVLFCGDMFYFPYISWLRNTCPKKFKAIGYLTIDGKLLSEWDYILPFFDEIITPSLFGQDELKRIGYRAQYAPYGVNKDTFHLIDANKIVIEKHGKKCPNTFICLIDKQNTGRSNIPDGLKAFQQFAKGKDDVHLIINAEENVGSGYNLHKIVEEMGITGKISFVTGCGSQRGVPDETINILYNSSDVLIWPSVGDGFGLGLLQAMRTHTVPVAVNYSSMTELLVGRGMLVFIKRTITGQHDIERALFDIDDMVYRLNLLYKSWKGDKEIINRLTANGMKFSENMTWENSGKEVLKSINRVGKKFDRKIEDINQIHYVPPVESMLASVITCVYNTNLKHLKACVKSVENQDYVNIEHILVNDGSTDKKVNKYLKKLSRSGSVKIKVIQSKNQGIVKATNLGIKSISKESEYVAFLDHDDYLFTTAVSESVKAVAEHGGMTYCDEVYIDGDNNLIRTHMKQVVTLGLLLQHNQVGHFNLLKRSLLDDIGDLFYTNCQDHYLSIKVAQKASLVHVPKILYAYRLHKDSVNFTDTVITATQTGESMIRHITGEEVVGGIYPGYYKIDRKIKGNPRVNIIILSKDNIPYLRDCIKSIRRNTLYSRKQIYVVDTGSKKKDTLLFLDQIIGEENVCVLYYPKKYNFSKANNWAISRIPKADYCLFLNDDTIVEPMWLTELLKTAQIEDAGMVGARLIFPQNELFQHAGIYFNTKLEGAHFAMNVPRSKTPPNAAVVRRMVSVTGACLLVKADLFNKVGGFDEELRKEWQEIGLSMKLRDLGYETYYTPYATAYHYCGVSRSKVNDGVDPDDRRFIFKKYGIKNLLDCDPEYQKIQRRESYGL